MLKFEDLFGTRIWKISLVCFLAIFSPWVTVAEYFQLTSCWEEDIVAVARTQIGNSCETDEKFTVYGEWYGAPSMDWNVCFVSYCANRAGIPLELRAGDVEGLIALGKSYNSFHSACEHVPEKGDIFFKKDEEDRITQCGIVQKVNGSIIYTIEGDVEDSVVERVYFRNDPVICAYISIWDLMKADGIVVIDEKMPEIKMAAEKKYPMKDEEEYYLSGEEDRREKEEKKKKEEKREEEK